MFALAPERVDRIEDALRTDKDGFYVDTTSGGVREVAEAAVKVIARYFGFDRSNPIVTKNGERVFFEPDPRTVARDGAEIAGYKYAAHLVTQAILGKRRRSLDSRKVESIVVIEGVLRDADSSNDEMLSLMWHHPDS